MTMEEISTIVAKQRSYFSTGATLPVKHRITALKKLRQTLIDNEQAIAQALRSDLGKSSEES